MSNVYPFQKMLGNTEIFRAEPTPEGVRITNAGGDGRETVQLISYEDAVNRLDAGDYDDSSTGYDIHLAVAEGGNCGKTVRPLLLSRTARHRRWRFIPMAKRLSRFIHSLSAWRWQITSRGQ